MAANTILQLTFKRADLKAATMSIVYPKTGLPVAEVNTAMAAIIAKNVFAPEDSPLETKVKAELIITALKGKLLDIPLFHKNIRLWITFEQGLCFSGKLSTVYGQTSR